MYMPVCGKVVEFNTMLEDNPEIINKDPYGDGWIIKINIKDKSEIDNLLTHSQYAESLNS